VDRRRANLTPLSAMGEPPDKWQITINRETCMGSGNCQFWAPNTFDLDDDGVAIVVDEAGDPEEKVVLAARGCPTQAISVHRDGAQIAP